MFLKKVAYFLFSLAILFAMGCEKRPNEIIDETDTDTDEVVTPNEVPPDDTKLMGKVVILKEEDNDEWVENPYDFNSATITGDTLTVSVSYSGNCETHEFTLLAESAFIEGDPFQIGVDAGIGISIVHNANLDMCEQRVEESYHFDLTPIKKKYQEEYKQDAGSIHLGILAWLHIVNFPNDVPTDLVYTFTE
ncbi:hypothetical protein C6501_06290 [Candidatus Poribacteria bacterium]|nr:MAG: hypothetical protein C6501_06290 [Candidatus Poribacteria bacterium]